MAQTPVKDSQASQSACENLNPNQSSSSPVHKPGNSPLMKSASSKKSAQKVINQTGFTPRIKKIQERKFVVAKKKPKQASETSESIFTCKCKDKVGENLKCPCIAYQNLRASQEGFFRSTGGVRSIDQAKVLEEEAEMKNQIAVNGDGFGDENIEVDGSTPDGAINPESNENRLSTGSGTSEKRRRDESVEEVMDGVLEPGSGKVSVLHLVKAFEKLSSTPKDAKVKENKEGEVTKRVMKWEVPFPGLQFQPKISEAEVSSSSECSSAPIFKSGKLGVDSRLSSSLDSSQGSFSFTSKASDRTRRTRRNSSESSGTFGGSRWKKKQLKTTHQQPFRLRTEQRGRCKEEEFQKKVQEMFVEEEKLRIPIAQGLPWTTDEPECLVKPPVKESTRPVDLKLHSDVRAVERSEFDHHVAEKLTMAEQYKLENERQQKLAEEEEVRRMRKVLVPRAQPMPYFDRPFIPQRSVKHPTIPKEPKFHIPQHKKIKCSASLNDMTIYNSHHQH